MSFSPKHTLPVLLAIISVVATTAAMASIASINPFYGCVQLTKLIIGFIAIILICICLYKLIFSAIKSSGLGNNISAFFLLIGIALLVIIFGLMPGSEYGKKGTVIDCAYGYTENGCIHRNAAYLYGHLLYEEDLTEQDQQAKMRYQQEAEAYTKARTPIYVTAEVENPGCLKINPPNIALQNPQQGEITFTALIDTTGYIISGGIVTSSGIPALDNATINGLAHCKFKTALEDGNPHRSWTVFKYIWQQNSEAGTSPLIPLPQENNKAPEDYQGDFYKASNSLGTHPIESVT